MNEDRRSFLKSAAAMTVGAGLFGSTAAYSYTEDSRAAALAASKRMRIVMPKVSRDLILRSTVGLRPHRPIGFRLEAEKIDGRTIVHNYGHGGSGWSLSWGTGHLAADMVDTTGETEVAVLGCGVVGLAAARLLQRRGKQVTIYAKELPPRVTSNYASAGWSPTATLCDPAKISDEFKAVFEKSARLSHRYFQDLIGQPYGVHYRQSIRFREKPAEPGGNASDPSFYGRVISDLVPKTVSLTPEQHGLPFAIATMSTQMRFETHTYLDAMLKDFAFFGGKVVIREFAKMDDILSLPQKVSVNCLGLGAKPVVNDEALMPIRGQLTILAPQPELTYGVGFEEFTASPRYDGVAVGSTMIPGDWNTVPDKTEQDRVVDGFANLLTKLPATA